MFRPEFNFALDIDRDTGPPNHIVKATSESLPNNIVEIRAMFDGPEVLWRYDADISLLLPPLFKKRIHFSAIAHMRRHQKNAHRQARRLADIEGMDINLVYCDFWINLNDSLSVEAFRGYHVCVFFHRKRGRNPRHPPRRSVICQIVCRRCGQAVTNDCYSNDKYWYGTYLTHLETCMPPVILNQV